MRLTSDESIEVVGCILEVADSAKARNVSLKIEAAHAGVVNGNFLFYTPKALTAGSDSLKEFYKPLQKKHYDKTLGYIYDSTYVDNQINSVHYRNIVKATGPDELVSAVKRYLKSSEYPKCKQGFGVLVAKAKLYDKKKIENLKEKDTGTVSIAGGSTLAYCSICSGMIAECEHKLGTRYNGEVCIGIVADGLEVDHISFETIPANWETKSLIITDSQLMGKIELVTEGQLMKLTLLELKEKLGNIENVLKELNLQDYLDQYNKDSEAALKSQFLLSSDQLLPTNTPLTIYVANAMLELLEDSEDKEIVLKEFSTLYTDLFADKTEEEIAVILKGEAQVVVLAPEPEVTPVTLEPALEPEPALPITDADKLALSIVDSLNTVIDNKFTSMVEQLSGMFAKENTAKANQLLEDKIEAFKTDLQSAAVFKDQLTEELKESILNQILLLKNVQRDTEYFAKLKDRSIQELKLTLEDHLELSKTSGPVPAAPVEPEVIPTPELKVADSNQHVLQIDVATATQAMTDPDANLVIEDADILVTSIMEKVGEKLSKAEFTTLYKSVVFEHGSPVAKKLHTALKAQKKI